MTKFKPFGITYEGRGLCNINLRFKPEPFSKVDLHKICGCKLRYSKSGYILFEACLEVGTDEYRMFVDEREKYNKIAATK